MDIQTANDLLLKKRQRLGITPLQLPKGQRWDNARIPDLPDSKPAKSSCNVICQFCGADIEPLEFDLFGTVRQVPGQCECAGAIQARKDTEIADRREWATSKANDLLRQANTPKRPYSFTNWNDDQYPKAGEYKSDVLEYVSTCKLSSKNWLFIHGPFGTGKTHLAVAALRKLIADHVLDKHLQTSQPWRGCFCDWVATCQAEKRSWSDRSNTNNLWSAMKGREVLVIDDIDKRKATEWALGELFNVIQHRYNHQKPTIITANHSLKQLQTSWSSSTDYVADVGGAILSRIVGQTSRVIHVVADDQRDNF